jgi:asparagine synthase (glutamine-hydrolysing)
MIDHMSYQKAMMSEPWHADPASWLLSYHNRKALSDPSKIRLLCHRDRSSQIEAQSEQYQVFFDGILYNRTELMNCLVDSVQPDTNNAELILSAYHQWGQKVINHIKGIFALLIWDREQNALLAVRDPIGIYPLFYTNAENEWLFSTSIHTLLKHKSVSSTVNRALLVEQIYHGWSNVEETFFQEIRRVPPGHILHIDRNHSATIERYWDLPIPGISCDWIQEDEVALFEQLLEQAIDRCLSLGSAAIYLSGGLDSVSIAAVAAERSRSKGLAAPRALSLVFPETCNEAEIQKAVAADLQLTQVLLPFEQAIETEGLLISALKMNADSSSPAMSPWKPAYYQLGLTGKQRGCQVILTGSGGDEWLGVTPLLAADLIRSLNIADFYHLWHSLQRSYDMPWYAMAENMLWRFGLKPVLGEVKRATFGRFLHTAIPGLLQAHRQSSFEQEQPDWLMPDPALRQTVQQRREHVWEQARQPQTTSSFYFREIRAGFDHPLTSMEMEEIFEDGNRLGMRILMPYWDVDLLTMLYRTPPRLLLQGGRSKGLVREAMARQFPQLGFERQKKVIAIDFFNKTMLREGKKAWHMLGGTPTLAALDILDEKRFTSAMTSILEQQDYQQAYRIWDILNLEAWLQSHL